MEKNSGEGGNAPELIIGLVGAVGSPMDAVVSQLVKQLKRFDYTAEQIRLSRLLRETPEGQKIDDSSKYSRISTSMDAGTALRERLGRGDALIALAAYEMRKIRRQRSGFDDEKEAPPPLANHCFILRSLKHEHEVDRLRQLYGDQFVLIGVYSPRSTRVDRLAGDFAAGKPDPQRDKAEELVQRDESEVGRKLGQNVREVFPLADAFVAVDELEKQLERVVDLFFGSPFDTPTMDEHGMFHAQAAALRSAALSRQVGACVTSKRGDILAVGCNEVPRAGGGQYWPRDKDDSRDFLKGKDQNDEIKRQLLSEFFSELQKTKWVTDAFRARRPEDIVGEALKKTRSSGEKDELRLAGTRVASLTEFGRDVHAEMSALMTLARLNLSSDRARLYCTTFPCHNCAKHIVAAGISRVVFIEPYPKSFAIKFHEDSIVLEDKKKGRVHFTPFVGIAPSKYLKWFRAGRRKDSDGTAVTWPDGPQLPVFATRVGGYSQADYDTESEFLSNVVALIV